MFFTKYFQVCHPRPEARHDGRLQLGAPGPVVQDAEADDGSASPVPDQ